MPTFEFYCESQDGSGHFRRGRIEADSEEEARLVLEERERDRAAFQLDPARVDELCQEYGVDDLDELPSPAPVGSSEADRAPFRALPVRDRAQLNIHRQDQPYKLVSLDKVG